jgi:NMD protein affecting ribosome stability and mRNA decay
MSNRQTQCTGKRKHDTRKSAELAAEEYLITFDQRMAVYVCRYCGSYHIGHHRMHRRETVDWDAIESDLSIGREISRSCVSGSLSDSEFRARLAALRRKFI